MIFKAYAVQTLSAATSFVQDLKLGHYIKVSPRATFLGMPIFLFENLLLTNSFLTTTVQVVGTALAAFIQVGFKGWLFANIPDVCSPNQKFYLTCPYNQVFFTASAVWSVLFFVVLSLS